MKSRKYHGFTLIELIVVIAIIGVLASILVPSMMGYINKAKKKSDISTARTIIQAVDTILAENDEAYESFYSCTSGVDVGVNRADGNQYYELVPVCMIDGISNSNLKSSDEFFGACEEAEDFTKAVNKSKLISSGNGNFICPIKYHGCEKKVTRWIVGYNADSQEPEVWTADAETGNGTPSYRLFPSVDSAYAG